MVTCLPSFLAVLQGTGSVQAGLVVTTQAPCHQRLLKPPAAIFDLAPRRRGLCLATLSEGTPG